MRKSWQDWTPRLAAFYADILRHTSGNSNRHLHSLGRVLANGMAADLSALRIEADHVVSKGAIVLDLRGSAAQGPLIEWPVDDDSSTEEPELDDAEPEALAGFDRTRAALLRIYRKQKGDPYNRETTLGFPILGGHVGRQHLTGPLLCWNVDLDYDPRSQRLTVSKRSSAPSLNSVLLERFADEHVDLDQVRAAVLRELLSDDFGLRSIDRVLDVVRGGIERLAATRPFKGTEAQKLPEFLRALRRGSTDEIPLLLSSAVLVNGPRSFAHLLEDLDEIRRMPQVHGASVLATLVGDVPEGIAEVDVPALPFQDSADGGPSLWFPGVSNAAQRRVAAKAARADVLTVQGPPGTGKSQTIANLLCHLVSQGKTVLVASHQVKALEVVADLLPPSDYLAMPVLRGDKESIQRLKGQLEATEGADSLPLATERDGLAAAEEYLHRLDRDLRHLARRYAELKQIEHEGFGEHAQYGALREYDRIDPGDEPDYSRAADLARELKEWAQVLVELAPTLEDLQGVFRPHGEETARTLELRIYQQLNALLDVAMKLLAPPSAAASELVEIVLTNPAGSDRQEKELAELSDFLERRANDLYEHSSSLGYLEPNDSLVRAWYAAALQMTTEEIRRFDNELSSAQAFFNASQINPAAVAQLPRLPRPDLERVLEVLDHAKGSVLRWYFSRQARRARRELSAAGLDGIRRRSAKREITRIRDLIAWQDKQVATERLLEDIAVAIAPSEEVRALTAKSIPLDRRVRSGRRACNLLQALLAMPVLRGGRSELAARLSFSLRPTDWPETAAVASEAALRLRHLRLIQRLRNELPTGGTWGDTITRFIDSLQTPGTDGGQSELAEKLAVLLDHYPSFQRLVDLESVELQRLRNTVSSLKGSILKERRIPDWIDHGALAIDAHRLGSLLRGSLRADPDDLTEISRQLQQGQKKRLRAIEQIVRRRRALAVAEAVRDPRHRVALRKVKRLLGRMRRTESLVRLRDSIDYDAVLKVFPAWLCTMEDVARLFPMRAGLFDVLIIDEASQCSQATALPLAYRAKKMIVVGDEKQLQPALSRFLAQATVDALQQVHRINEHPRAVFLNGKDSLLELAESCSNAKEFLDEHFRCAPEIIRWSNHRFYRDRLRILTPRRAKMFRVPLRVVSVPDADDDPERKVNRREAEAVVTEARRLVESGAADRLTIGILSPYRQQADLLQELLLREFSDMPDALRNHRMLAATADGFQGDERDIILYSFRYGPSTPPGTVLAIQREEERLNVAFTRARRLGICFISAPTERFPDGAIRSFLQHARGVEARLEAGSVAPRRPDVFDSEFEREVCERLRDRGLQVSTQEPCAGFFIDLIVEDSEGRVLAVECDGAWKEDEFGRLRPEDYQRQDLLERAGWVIHRVSGRRYFLNPELELDRIVQRLAEQPTAQDREIVIGSRFRPADTAADDRETEPGSALTPSVVERSAEEPAIPGDTAHAREEAAERAPARIPELLRGFEDDAATLVRKLLRWYMYEDRGLEGGAMEALNDIIEALSKGRALAPEDEDYLRELWTAAIRRRFDPKRIDLPLRPEQ